jgi:hypothetical protein
MDGAAPLSCQDIVNDDSWITAPAAGDVKATAANALEASPTMSRTDFLSFMMVACSDLLEDVSECIKFVRNC